VPESPGVFALRGARAEDEPYLTRTANLRRRMARLLSPPDAVDAEGRVLLSKRLNLREKVARIEWSVTGSEFESNLVLYCAAAAEFGYEAARKRLRLHMPFFLRLAMENAHPRVYVTNKLSRRGLALMYGPIPSRAAAERYCDEALNLFKLRRCYEDLEPYPEHPGCAYGEMKKCLAPCQQACSAEEYAAEAAGVKAFFDTHGESMLAAIEAERERASAEMDFEKAAALHVQWQKVKAVAALAEEIVRPIPELRAVIVQRAAKREGGHAEEAAVFLLNSGRIAGPERLSTLGVRAVREQTSVGSSLFAQPLMLQAVPLEPEAVVDAPEVRAERVLAALEQRVRDGDLAEKSDHLSLLRRWYYRPEKQRVGEIFFPNADGGWPVRRILRGAARVVIGEPGVMAEVDREAAKDVANDVMMRVLHDGRGGVERIVPVVPKSPGGGSI
jgi:excinuclease UvrABC nuclease subunit